MKKKVVTITAILVPESWEKTDKEIETDIKKELKSGDIPWCERIEKITVLNEG